MTGSRRDLPSRAVRWLRGAGTVVATVVLAGVLVVALVVGRSSPPGPSGGSDPTPASTSAAVVPPPSSAPSAAPEPTPAPVGASPTAVAVLDPSPSPDAATPRPTASPNPRPTAEPTPRPTADPTPRPKPTPLPTPVVHRYTAHGSFGNTLTVKGIAIRVVPAEPDLAQATICRTDDPERQGWTEVLTYEITATWPDPSDADDPMFEVGAHPWFVTLYDPPVTSGVRSRVTTCHRPGDSMVVHVGLSGGQDANEILIEYEWYFG